MIKFKKNNQIKELIKLKSNQLKDNINKIRIFIKK